MQLSRGGLARSSDEAAVIIGKALFPDKAFRKYLTELSEFASAASKRVRVGSLRLTIID